MTKLPVYVPVGRRPRNLVLSVCDFKLHQQAGPAGGSFRAGAAPPEASSGPPGRVGCKLIVGRGTQLLLHGGADETGCYGDLHAIELEKAACTELLVGGFSKPTGRYGHSLCAHGEVAILFGGLAEAESATQQLKATPPPFLTDRARWNHQAQPTADLFTLQLDELEWMQPETEGQAPQPRAFHAAAICEDALLIFGGVLDSAFSEVCRCCKLLLLWMLRLQGDDPIRPSGEACGEERQRTEEASTEELSANGVSEDLRFILRGASPAPRYGHAMARVPKKNRCIMFGGEEDGGTLWCLDLNFAYHGPRSSNSSNKNLLPGGNVNLLQKVEASWSRIETYRTGPQSRRFHSLALIGAERLVIFGGVAVSKPQDPTGFYVLDLNACRWRRPMYEGSACLSGAGEAVLHDKLILFGGASVTHSIRHLSGSPAPAEAKDASNLPVGAVCLYLRTKGLSAAREFGVFACRSTWRFASPQSRCLRLAACLSEAA
ncbi:Ras family domain-containing protein [Cyclospora cayetanensis]|uniref:Ras family domain-containing protein n=1 Tax=Cyclospora cayetanensis TaxID=88456 RepID=A0A1D3D2K2_9EIME|nr:Ras family domain-containing protein [Cyclospora cayetanensis]